MTASNSSKYFDSQANNISFSHKNKAKNTKIKFGKYNFMVAIAIILPTFFVGLFNWFIDPYGVFGNNNFIGWNHSKPEKLKNTRFFKAVDFTKIKPKTIFLGSSRIEYGLEPTHTALQNSQPVYNFAFGAATTYEMLRYLQYAIANQPELKTVFIGLDEFMFNELHQEGAGFAEERLEKNGLIFKDFLNSILAITAIEASFTTIKSSQNNPQERVYTPEGRLYPRAIDRNRAATKYRFIKSFELYFNLFPEYKLSKKSLNNLQQIVNLCQQHNIDLKVFISPVHASRLEVIYQAGHWQQYEQMKREIVNIIPVWDFSGYNTITTETLDNNIQNYIDDSHYRKEVGDLVITRILNSQAHPIPNDFGTIVDYKNIENHLSKIRNDRAAWSEKNLRTIEMIKTSFSQ